MWDKGLIVCRKDYKRWTCCPVTRQLTLKLEEVRSALNVWLDAKNTMWKQRSRNFWLTERDRNTSFFHIKAINCKQCNTIHGLCDANGDWQEDDFQIEQITVDYFSNIFCSQGPTNATTLIDVVDPAVSTDINNFLTQEFMAEEVHKTLKHAPKKISQP